MTPRSSGARELWFAGVRVVLHVHADQSEGRLGVWESHEVRGSALPLHIHTREDEQIVVLDGEIVMRVGDATHRLSRGATLALPRGIAHAHLVTSEQARLLTIALPGGFERLFTELGTPAAPGTTPPPMPNDERLAALLRQLGVERVGPPPAVPGPVLGR